MSKDDEWIKIRISEARKSNPLVTETVSTHLRELLKGPITERHLPKAELANLAKALIADMLPS